jgi:hypothetical protein
MVSFRPFGGRALPSVLARRMPGASGPANLDDLGKHHSRRILMKISICALALTLATSGGLQASVLYSFGPDTFNDPRSFTSINTQTSTAGSLYNMNDVNDGFNGGVTFRPSNGLFYAIINDSSFNSSLISFSLGGGGAFTNLQSIGVGFSGGLTFDTADGNFYAISLDSFGFSTLNKINLGGATNALFGLGNGFNGGLTFDSLDGNLYAISNDNSGNSTLNRITLGGSVTGLSGTLGTGFLGGVVYDRATNSFFALDNDSLGNSTLDKIIVSGSSVVSVATLFTVGAGFVNAGLTEPVPEPSTLWLFACGAAMILVRRRRNVPRG